LTHYEKKSRTNVKLEAKHIVKKYRSRTVVNDVSFELLPGQMLAITGESGAGKSTLIELLPRLHDPQQGRVLIDGQDIRSFTLSSLRAQMAFVLQDTLLFAASIRENIAYGKLDASDEEIEQAARLAAAHDFIMRQVDGYDTIIGERGVTLSVGQRQRIAVARAALSNAPLLILDEPLASLDQDNQEQVLKALYRLARGRTTIMISHDPDHALRADLTMHLEKGRIVQGAQS